LGKWEMNGHRPQELSTNRLLLALRRASKAEAKSLSDEEELGVAIKREDEMNEDQPQTLPTDIPSESPLSFLRRASVADAKSLSDEDEQRLAAELERTAQASQAMRTAAYCDAINLVARAMQRRGQNLTCWTEKDAEAAREIAEILIGLDSQS
jgi:hypothetical protein